jgi:sulfotransferase
VERGIHFISGLPRAGSTLLAALLRQNPVLHADITSPSGALVTGMLRGISQGNESALMIDDAQRESLLRGVFDNYYQALHPIKTAFDANRRWTTRLTLLATLYPQAKIICCVRQISWSLDSIERLIRQNRWELSKLFDFDPGGTVYSRAAGLMGPERLVGFSVNAVKQAMHSAESGRLMLLPYDLLAGDPAYALKQIYEFTGLEPFEHDFESVSFEAAEFDARLGTPGLHRIAPMVARAERRSILPPDLWSRYEGEALWRKPKFNVRGVRIL